VHSQSTLQRHLNEHPIPFDFLIFFVYLILIDIYPTEWGNEVLIPLK
jgi:hypothetical protein